MLPHLSVILCPLVTLIHHPPHYCGAGLSTDLCGPEKDLAPKKEGIHATHPSHISMVSLFLCTNSEEMGSCQLSTQRNKAAIFRSQAQTCDSNLCCGGFTAALFVA